MLMNISISAHNCNLISKLSLFYKYILIFVNYKIMIKIAQITVLETQKQETKIKDKQIIIKVHNLEQKLLYFFRRLISNSQHQMEAKKKTKLSEHNSMEMENQGHSYRKTNQSLFGTNTCYNNIMNQSSASFHKKITNRNSYQNSLYSTLTAKYSNEYQLIQENDRILKRIINPKRDKTILRSVQSVKKQNQSRSKTKDRNIGKCSSLNEKRAKSQQKPRRKWVNCINNRNILEKWRIDDTQQQFHRKQENQRMGKRIMNVKSIYRNLVSNDQPNRGRITVNSKINRGVRAFFHLKSQPSSAANQCSNQVTQNLVTIKPYYGYGPTILALSNIEITIFPQPKQTDLFMFELIIKNANSKYYRTCFIPYNILPSIQIKFALRLKRIGQFVPLKIWKANGVQNIQIGIVDILFGRYLEIQGRRQLILDGEDQFVGNQRSSNMANMGQLVQENKQGKTRVIVADKLDCRLRKQKKQELLGSLKMDYAIYRKRYK